MLDSVVEAILFMICIVTLQLISMGYLLKLSKNDKQKSRNTDLCQNRGKVHQDI